MSGFDKPNQAMQLTASSPRRVRHAADNAASYAFSVCRRKRLLRFMDSGSRSLISGPVEPIKNLLKTSILLPICAVAISPLLAASWLDRPPLPDQLLSSRRNIHQAVLALEREPLHKNAALIRALLVGHFQKVDYLICGGVLGPLTEAKVFEPVMFQIVIASGDWVEEHPERAKDIPAYTLAGLESGVRAYKNLRAAKPGVKHKLLDELLGKYENNTLRQWNAEHPCRPR